VTIKSGEYRYRGYLCTKSDRERLAGGEYDCRGAKGLVRCRSEDCRRGVKPIQRTTRWYTITIPSPSFPYVLFFLFFFFRISFFLSLSPLYPQTTGATRTQFAKKSDQRFRKGRMRAPILEWPGLASPAAMPNPTARLNMPIRYATNAVLASINAAGSYTSVAARTVALVPFLVQMTLRRGCQPGRAKSPARMSAHRYHFDQPGSGTGYLATLIMRELRADGWKRLSRSRNDVGTTRPLYRKRDTAPDYGAAFCSCV